MEKYKELEIENFSETIENFKELTIIRKEIYQNNYDLLCRWYELVKFFKQGYKESRFHHFLMSSTLSSEDKSNSNRINDLEGDFSAENFLRASAEERVEMIKRLNDMLETERNKNEVAQIYN